MPEKKYKRALYLNVNCEKTLEMCALVLTAGVGEIVTAKRVKSSLIKCVVNKGSARTWLC